MFPADDEVRALPRAEGREADWRELLADADATYDVNDEIDLVHPRAAHRLPSSPGNVVPVREVAGREIYQVVIGSSANPGLRDFAVPAMMVSGRQTHDRVSFDVNPTRVRRSRTSTREGWPARVGRTAGARLHQAGCNGCIGMGQAPADGRDQPADVPAQLPRTLGNARGRGLPLQSWRPRPPSALTGVITDPRDLGMPVPARTEPPPQQLS